MFIYSKDANGKKRLSMIGLGKITLILKMHKKKVKAIKLSALLVFISLESHRYGFGIVTDILAVEGIEWKILMKMECYHIC